MIKIEEKCVYFKNNENCTCNNELDEPGECFYENGIEPKNPSLKCPYFKTVEGDI